MKKNTNTTTESTTVPSVTASEVTAATAAAMIDLDETLKSALTIGDVENIRTMYLMGLIKSGYSIEAVTNANKEFEGLAEEVRREAEEKAKIEAEEKAEAEAEERINKLNTSDRIMMRIIETIKTFDSDNTTADDIKNMLLENSSTIKVAAFIGGKLADEKEMKIITYIYESIKCEKELIRFSATFVKVVRELIGK